MTSPWKVKMGLRREDKPQALFIILLEDFQETIQTRDGRYTAHVNHEHIRDEKDLRLMLGWPSHPSAC